MTPVLFPFRRRRRAAVAAVVLACAAVAATACQRAAPVTRVPAELVNNLVVVPGRINGSAPLAFVLDTGASTSVIDRDTATALRLDLGTAGRATTGGGDVESVTVPGANLTIAGLAFADLPLVAIDLAGLRAGLGHPVAGILGYDVFAPYVVEIDYLAPAVRFHDPEAWPPPPGATAVRFAAMDDQIPLVDVELRGVNGARALARVELDTGQTGALTLTSRFVAEHRIVDDLQPRVSITAGAILAGRVPAYVARLDSLRLGATDVAKPVVTVTPGAAQAGVTDSTAGLIGGEVFRRFHLFIDYARRQLWVQPNADAATALEFDMSGLSLAALPPDWRSYRVRAVVAASPAADAGLKADDVVVDVDGRPAADYSLTELRRLLRVPGDRVVTVERDGAMLTVTVRGRRLI